MVRVEYSVCGGPFGEVRWLGSEKKEWRMVDEKLLEDFGSHKVI